mgnify:CR=1 FL=1
MAIPANLSLVTVTGTYIDISGVPIAGQVKFTPRAVLRNVTSNVILVNSTIVVTLEPCAMCAGAISQARIKTLVFGAWDAKAGAVGSVWDVLRDPRTLHQVEVVSGVNESECAPLLQQN